MYWVCVCGWVAGVEMGEGREGKGRDGMGWDGIGLS